MTRLEDMSDLPDVADLYDEDEIDDNDEGIGAPMRRRTKVIQGQRVEFALTPAGTLVQSVQTLARGEDSRVTTWEVNIAPVTRKGVGADIFGMPMRFVGAADGDAGGLVCQMRWGGGGVNFNTQFEYPVNGASFAVSGDNVMLTVVPRNIVTVFTEETKPVAAAWLRPDATPMGLAPLVQWQGIPAATPIFLSPWTRAIYVGKGTAAASVLVEFFGFGGLIASFTLNVQYVGERIPIPNNCERVALTPSVGTVSLGQEAVFV